MSNLYKTTTVSTPYLLGTKARDKVIEGAYKLASIVKPTLGPNGSIVVIDKVGQDKPHATKDGVTVAKSVFLKDIFEQMGCDLMRESSLKTLSEVGDGTTSSVLLAESMIQSGVEFIRNNNNEIKEYFKILDNYDKEVSDNLQKNKRDAKDEQTLKEVAMVASNGDEEVSRIVSKAVHGIQKNGTIYGAINIIESNEKESAIETVNGFNIDVGYISPYFSLGFKDQKVKYENPYIFLAATDCVVSGRLFEVLETYAALYQLTRRPLVVIAKDIGGPCLAHLIRQKTEAGFPICAIKLPFELKVQYEIFKDLSVITGAKLYDPEERTRLEFLFSESTPLEDREKNFGSIDKIEITDKKCTFISQNEDAEQLKRVKDYLDILQDKIENKVTETVEKNNLIKRISQLTTGICIIHVGGSNDIDRQERKDRVDDAVNATIAAFKEGIVKGGGEAYFSTQNEVSKKFSKCIFDSLDIDKIPDDIYDPVKVIRLVVKNAVAVTKTILSTMGAISCPTDVPYEEAKKPLKVRTFD